MRLHATINYLQLHLDIFAIISCVGHICNYFGVRLSMWTTFSLFSCKKNNLSPISCKCDQFSYIPMSIQRCILWILRNIFGCIKIYKCIWTTILYVYSSIIISINGLDNMVTLNSVYFEHIKLLCKIFLLNILCPYYKFITTILLYLLKLLQMTFIIIILLILDYILILITCDKKLNFNIIFD